MQDKVLAQLKELIASDPDLLGFIQEPVSDGVVVAHGRCVFSLQGLYQWVGLESDMSFKEFRSELYQGDLNTCLKAIGYGVEIKESTGKVETNLYQLVKL